MRQIGIMVLFFLWMIIPLAKGEESQPAKIVIGFNPGGQPQNIKKQGLDLAKLVQKRFGIPVEVYISKDYSSLVEAMKNKKIDFAFFSSLTYVIAEKEAGAKVLLKKVWTNPFYFSALVTLENSAIKTIDQLKGQRIAFVDKNSTSGYLYPQVMFKKNKIADKDFKQIIFSQNHSASIELLEKKSVDAVAVFSDDADAKSGAWNKFAKNKNNKFRVLWISEPIPTDPFCVRQGFYDQFPKFTHSLMFSLIDIFSENKSTGRFDEVLGNQDLLPATSKQYDTVREMVKELNLRPQ